ncbi:MAG TPA: GNAT family N-acetyltransferase [Gemmataceae bacterium]|nr:GNAT family N-acetyltransferase [Gemmataceae bacterium]
MIRVRPMTAADVPLGMRLKEQAGWNQLEADWQRFLDMEPAGCFVAELDGTPAGTTTTCVFGPVAWVAMVLVDQAVRGRGVGRALMEHALAFLDGRGVRSVRLDATPLGRPLYEKLGFVTEYELGRHAGPPSSTGPVAGVTTGCHAHHEEILRLDQAVSGADRRKFLSRLFAERPEELRVVERAGRLPGYLTVRPGSSALQIGPCMASAEAGPLLLADAFHRHAGRTVYVDVPLSHAVAREIAAEHGLAMQRLLLRMGRGEPAGERVAELWASSGPELG